MFLNTDQHIPASKAFFESQLAAYNGYLAEIMSSASLDFSNARVADALSKVSMLVGDIAKNAPVGSEDAMAMLLSSVNNAHVSCEQASQAHHAARQAMLQVQASCAPAKAHGASKSKRNLLG
jgi:hypothetical protein